MYALSVVLTSVNDTLYVFLFVCARKTQRQPLASLSAALLMLTMTHRHHRQGRVVCTIVCAGVRISVACG